MSGRRVNGRNRRAAVGVAVALLATVIIGAGCASSGASAEDSGHGSNAPAARRTSRAVDCASVGVETNPRLTCGVVTVPEDRTRPHGRRVTLPFAVIHSASPHRRPDPIVYLAGGPGGAGLTATKTFLGLDLGGPRDVVLFDQRGTGRATPSLDCPEVEEELLRLLSTTDAPAVEHARVASGFAACRRRLVARGIDLNAYTTSVNADDVDDVRAALGYRRWNLLGVSYGTTLALETMRRHPGEVRSVVLDSVFPPTVPENAVKLATTADRVVAKLLDGCAADTGCRARYPSLGTDLRDVVAAFDRAPYATTVRDPVTGAPRVLRLTGADLVAGLYQAFYDSSLIPLLPSVIEALHHGANGIIDALAAQQLPILGAIAEGMNLSVNCADRQRLDDPRRDAAALAARPQYATLVETSFADDCGVWHVRSAPRSFNRPVRSRIPTLVFADEYDPVTPPTDGHRAAATLFRSRVLDLPGLGHAAVFSGSRCPPSIVAAFFVAGDPAVDTSCVAAMPPPNWR